ncbi:MAG: LPS assembly protein LptD [Parvularculales bacterium]
MDSNSDITQQMDGHYIAIVQFFKIINLFFMLIITLVSVHSFAYEQTTPPLNPLDDLTTGRVLIQADVLSYNEVTMVITAEGNVELTHNNHTLLANYIRYDQKSGTAHASGSVRIIDSEGNVISADSIELDDSLNSSLVLMPSLLMADNARLAAKQGELSDDGNVRTLHNVVYSPCRLCLSETRESKVPLWQIKAGKVVHDTKVQTIRYENARLEFFGIPVAWLPFLIQPDPLVKRQTGFLAPNVGISSDLGAYVETPWFWSLAPNYDLTVTPQYYTKSGLLLHNEWRHRLHSGTYTVRASGILTQDASARGPNGKMFRGSLFVRGQFDIDEETRWGVDLETTTDDTFLRRYNITDSTDLVSRLYVENQSGLNYGSVTGYHFQNLLDKNQRAILPVVTPLASYSHLWPELVQGGVVTIDSNLMILTRKKGATSRRLSNALTWQRQFYDTAGGAWKTLAQVRGDIYSVTDIPDNTRQPVRESGEQWTGRFLPTAGLEWRLPLVHNGTGFNQILEPIAQLFVAPESRNRDKIPNEDSLSVELDETNLFALNRSSGFDRWEGGIRANVGVKMTIVGTNSHNSAQFLFGQVYRTHSEKAFAGNPSLAGRRSDYVGLISLTLAPWLSLEHRVRLDHEDFAVRRNDINLKTQFGIFQLDAGYVKLSGDLASDTEVNKEARFKFSANIHQNWTAYGSWRRNLTTERTIKGDTGLRYEDECLIVDMALQNDFTEDRDISSNRRLYVQISLKTLGGTQFTTALDDGKNETSF